MTAVTTPTVPFPSLAWFQALADAAARDPDRYRRLGWAELVLGVVVGEERYRLTFDGYTCTEVAPWAPGERVDCWIEAAPADWRELIEHLQARGRADARHTLNSLVLADERFHLRADEQLGADAFYRFNATLQAFIEEAGNVPTEFR